MRIRGGIWKNTDDEVLDAAVMKYGNNQGSRVSSLLLSKSARQCKTRWNERLEPSMKKTEWTREETETLLQLARSLPAQWRTAAPTVRTPSHCLQGYNKQVSAAYSAAENGDHDPGKLQPEATDPHSESIPACPDPVDMVDEEKTVLSEACARLGNTRGKRAKRKAKKKLLEEASRLASLRKRRELTSVGTATTKLSRRTSRGIGLNAETASEKRPPPGFSDATDEGRPVVEQPMFPTKIGQLQGRRRADVEAQQRKQDIARNNIVQRKDAPNVIMQANRLVDFPEAIKKAKLMLPPTQFTDRDLEDITKMGYSSFDMLSGIEDILAGGPITPTRALLANYSETSRRELLTRFRTSNSTTGKNVDPVILAAPLQKQPSDTTGLPQPQNEYQVVIKSVATENKEVEETEEDTLGRVASERAEDYGRHESPLEKRTRVLRGELPRLSLASWDHFLMKESEDKRSSLVPQTLWEQANELINREIFILLEHDNAKYPLDEEAATKKKTRSAHASNVKPAVCIPKLDVFDENELKEAEFLLMQETQLLLTEMGHTDTSLEDSVKARDTCMEDHRFFPGRGRYDLPSIASDGEKLKALKSEFDNLKRRLGEAAKKATESEQKLALSHGRVLDGICTQMEQNWMNLRYLEVLQRQEHMAASSRVKCMIEEVNKQTEVRRTLERKYEVLFVDLLRINTLMEACPVAEN